MINEYEIIPMTEEIGKEISNWKYEDDYSDYNLPTYDEMKLKNYGLTNKNNFNNYLCFLKDNMLVAYSSMKEIDGKIFLGIGIRPEFCGKGLGKEFLNLSIDEIKRRFPNKKIFLDVRSWNERAIKSYIAAGFSIVRKVIKKDRLGKDAEFIEMELI